MKKKIPALVIVLLAGLFFYVSTGTAHMGMGMMGSGPGRSGYAGNYCPWCGRYLDSYGGYGMGPGMMGGYGYGMGPGMMYRGRYGYGMGPGMMGGMMGPGYGYDWRNGPQYGQQYGQLQKPLDRDQAKQEVENYLSALRNPNLKVGKVEEKGDDFQVDIETKDGSLVDKMLVDKNTGRMRSVY